jgi:hypothetical protein
MTSRLIAALNAAWRSIRRAQRIGKPLLTNAEQMAAPTDWPARATHSRMAPGSRERVKAVFIFDASFEAACWPLEEAYLKEAAVRRMLWFDASPNSMIHAV